MAVRGTFLYSLIFNILASGMAMADAGEAPALTFSTSPFGSTVATLQNVHSGCIARFATTTSGNLSHFQIETAAQPSGCFVPPPGTENLRVDLGVQPAGHYQVEWNVTSVQGDVHRVGSFDVAAPTAAYITPKCPFDTCFRTGPSEPTTDEPTEIGFNIISNSYPSCTEVLNPAVTIQGNLILVTGTQTSRTDGCVSFLPPAARAVFVVLPLLPVGTYTAALKLNPNPSAPTPVVTINGLVDAGIIMVGEFTVSAPADTSKVNVIEYFYPPFEHYFITADASEIALLDARQPPFQDWVRTGFSFKMYKPEAYAANAVSVCRFFNDSFAPKSSHFYAAHGLGCEQTLATFPDWTLESAAVFAAPIPEDNGQCPEGTGVFRLYNNGMGGAPNHRFTISTSEKQRMIDAGWTPEGYGPGIAMCSPI